MADAGAASASTSGRKRKRSEVAEDGRASSGAAAAAAAEPPIKRRVKGWKRDGAGAPEIAPGRYVHRWNEHRAADSDQQFKYGPFSPEEDARLKEVYEAVCAELHIADPSEPVVNPVWKGDMSRVWKEVASHFRNRTLRALLRRLQRLYFPLTSRGPWKPEEDIELLLHVAERGPAFGAIARVMGRLEKSVAARYATLSSPHERGRWSPAELQALIDAVKKHGTPVASGAGEWWSWVGRPGAAAPAVAVTTC